MCLYDYNGIAVACNRETPSPGDPSGGHQTVRATAPNVETNEIWELVGPPGVPIWQVRWFICSGSGYVTIHGDEFCVDCPAQNNGLIPVCEPDQCEENFLPTVASFGTTCQGDPAFVPGLEAVKVKMTNECYTAQTIHYWWQIAQGGSNREIGPYGVTIPARAGMDGNPALFLCNSMHINAGDGHRSFLFFRRGRGSCPMSAVSAGMTCIADTGQYFSNMQPGTCVPPGNP